MKVELKVGDVVRKKDERDKYRVVKVKELEPRYEIQWSIDIGSREWVSTSQIELED